jgi:hypothetical protein
MIIGRCILTYNLIKDGMSFMKSMIRAAMRLFFGGCFSVSVYGQATSDHKSLDPVIDSALAGYNAGDSKAFFAGYAKALAAVATEPMFTRITTLRPTGNTYRAGRLTLRRCLTRIRRWWSIRRNSKRIKR